ncbi:DUF3854 domain-containing protein [Cyanobacteria bacterium FACHB-63]|nr:DUF3854 domain-containing protein [Cyanobacteria bacterium FACHB-63]
MSEKLVSVTPLEGLQSYKNNNTNDCLNANNSLEAFSQAIRKEFIGGSGIAPDLFASVKFIEDTGRWEPNFALGQQVSIFWKTRKPHFYGAIAAIIQEDGQLWQAKPMNPRFDARKNKPQKYESLKDKGSPVFLPSVPQLIREQISKRTGLNIPSEGSFWDWVENCPSAPLILAEGAKKALCLLSNGFIAIAGYGCNGFHSKNEKINGEKIRRIKPELSANLKRFVAPGRKIIIALDADANPATAKTVSQATLELAKILSGAGCEVSIAAWDGENGRCKGVDDLIVNRGIEAWESALESALSFDQWQRQRYSKELWQLSYKPSLSLNQRYLGAIPFPQSGLACVRSRKGSGKTRSLVPTIREASAVGRKVLVITHRIQLGRAISEAVGIKWIEDAGINDRRESGYGLCIDSLHENSQAAFNPDDWDGAIVVLDEVEQVIWHLLNSSTCKTERIKIISTLRQLLRNVASTGGLIIAQDADLSDASINFLRGLIGENAPHPWIAVNEWRDSSTAWNCSVYESKSPADLLLAAGAMLDAEQKIFIACDSQKAKSTWGAKNLEKYFAQQCPGKKILRIDSETVSDPDHAAYGSIEKINEVVKRFDVVIATPTIGTGVSIDVEGHFSAVFGIFQGAIPESEARQALGRVRENAPRYIWARSMGLGSIGNGSKFPNELIRSTQKTAMANMRLLKDADLLELDLDETASMIDVVCFKAWAKMAARINAGMPSYRQSLAESLSNEGHSVAWADAADEDAADEIKTEIKEIRIESQSDEALAIAEAEQIDDKQYELLKAKRAKVESERLQQRKYELQKLYGIEVSPDLHIKDENGFYSKIRLHYLLMQNDSQIAEQADSNEIDSSLIGGDGKTLYLPDLTPRTARVKLLAALGIPALISPLRGGIRASDADIQVLIENIKRHRRTIKDVLGLSFSDKYLEKPMQAVKLLLAKIGFTATARRSRTESGDREYVYSVPTLQDERWEIFKAWDERRNSVSSSDTVCPDSEYINKQNNESRDRTEYSPEDLMDVREMWISADKESREILKATFPHEMLAAAIAA